MPEPKNDRDKLPIARLLPNAVTILGLCVGLTSIRFTLAGEFEPAAILIMLSALLDRLDGLLARRLNATSSFGAELDSLSDFVCFGVAPALLMFEISLAGAPGYGWTFALVYAVCCSLRLARFNVRRGDPAGLPNSLSTGAPGAVPVEAVARAVYPAMAEPRHTAGQNAGVRRFGRFRSGTRYRKRPKKTARRFPRMPGKTRRIVRRRVPRQPSRHAFLGVPAPAGAFLALLPLFLTFDGLVDATGPPWIVAPYLGLVGVLMVCRVPTLSAKALRIPKSRVPLLFVGMAIIAGGIFARFWLTVAVLSFAYIVTVVHAFVAYARRKRWARAEIALAPPEAESEELGEDTEEPFEDEPAQRMNPEDPRQGEDGEESP